MTSIGDCKISLRKLDYPMCAVEALSRLGMFVHFTHTGHLLTGLLLQRGSSPVGINRTWLCR